MYLFASATLILIDAKYPFLIGASKPIQISSWLRTTIYRRARFDNIVLSPSSSFLA
jgi:hypothetical protein